MAVAKKAPQGYVGTPEAARLLGVTQQTIRNRIRAGTLKGKEAQYPDGERRYYVERPALDLELSRGGQVARYESIADYSQTSLTIRARPQCFGTRWRPKTRNIPGASKTWSTTRRK